MKVLVNKYDKSKIPELPRGVFEGRIIVVQSEMEVDKAVDYLLTFSRLGVDTETRPSFRRGAQNKVALLQISTSDTCFLFRLDRTGLTPSLVRLLEHKDVCKIGLSLRDDLASLRKRADFVPNSFVELQEVVKQLGIEDQSLQKIYANVFGRKISKGQRLSNWEADVLSDGQKLYAATDAWACLRLHEEIESLLNSGDYELQVLPEPITEQI